MKIAIEPVPCFNGPAVWLECIDTQVNLGVGLNTEFRLLNAAGEMVSARERASLTDEQYNAWVGDDAFVCECIAENKGLSLPV